MLEVGNRVQYKDDHQYTGVVTEIEAHAEHSDEGLCIKVEWDDKTHVDTNDWYDLDQLEQLHPS